MKHGSNQRRPRSRNQGQGRKPSRNHSYESNHPDIKVRGTAQQVFDKYMTLARDATSAGDRIAAESFYQFAEHYFRILSADGGDQKNQRNQRQGDTPASDLNGGDQNQDNADDGNADQKNGNNNSNNTEQSSADATDNDGDKEQRPKRRVPRAPRRTRSQRADEHKSSEDEARLDGASIAAALPEAVLPSPAADAVKPRVAAKKKASDDEEAEPLSA